MVYWQYDMLLVCFTLVRTRGPWPDQKSRVNDMTHTTKYHRKRAYFGASTAVPYQVCSVRYTVRIRMIRTRYILRILVSHDTGSVSRPHTHWYASTSVAERGLVV